MMGDHYARCDDCDNWLTNCTCFDATRRAVGEGRPEVLAFAQLMERELRANDHKPGWKNDTAVSLAARVGEEAYKLEQAVSQLERQVVWAPDHDPRPCNGWRRKGAKGVGYEPATGELRDELLATIAREAADTANMAMMVADVCGQLPALRAAKPAAFPFAGTTFETRAERAEREAKPADEGLRELLREAMARRLEQRLPTGGSGVPKRLAAERRTYHRIILDELDAALSETAT